MPFVLFLQLQPTFHFLPNFLYPHPPFYIDDTPEPAPHSLHLLLKAPSFLPCPAIHSLLPLYCHSSIPPFFPVYLAARYLLAPASFLIPVLNSHFFAPSSVPASPWSSCRTPPSDACLFTSIVDQHRFDVNPEYEFPFWCRSISGSGLASKRCRSTWGFKHFENQKFCCYCCLLLLVYCCHSIVSLQWYIFLISHQCPKVYRNNF